MQVPRSASPLISTLAIIAFAIGIIRRMLFVLRHPALRIAVVLLVVLGLGVQPNWLPLLQDVQTASQSTKLTAASLAAIKDAFARQPWDASRANSAGLAALAAGDFDTALTDLSTAARLGGWTPELHIAVGDAYNGKNDLKNSLAEWEAALPNRLNDADLLNRLARGYESTGQYPQASAALRSLVALQPQNAVARYRFGLVLAVIDPASAPQHLELAAGMDPSVGPFAASLDKAVEAGLKTNDKAYTYGVIGYALITLREYPLAKAALLRAIEERPNFADAYAYLGLAEDELGNDGTYAYTRALDLNPDLALGHYLVGLHYRRLGKNDDAIKSLTKAFGLDNSNAAAAAELGSTYADMADLPDAETWYRQAVRVAPDDATFWLLLARFYTDHELKTDTDSILCAQKAVELAPDSAEAYDLLGYAQYLNDQPKDAESSLLKSKDLDPKRASTYFHLGVLYLDNNRPAEAKENLEHAVSLDAGGPIAEQAFKALARLGITAQLTPAPTATTGASSP